MDFDASRLPKNGLLSGMCITWMSGAVALAAGLLYAPAQRAFDTAPPEALLDAFLVTVVVMAVHKVESYLTGEFNQCPVYFTSGNASWAQNPRQAIFAAFVSTFLGMMFLVYLTMRGGHWPMLLMGVWAAQGLHEYHHSAKSLARRSYYPGTVTGLLFAAAVGGLLFPAWAGALGVSGPLFYAFYAAQPLVLLAFYLEDRRWLAGAAEAGFRPGAAAGGRALL